MTINLTTLWVPKEGNAPDEYEDAAAPSSAATATAEIFRCAVADGASESSFAAAWAKLLVNGYVEGFDLLKLQEQWRQKTRQSSLAWYAEEKARMGAFATLLGLTIKSNKRWEARAIGDSCLFHVRNGAVFFSFPLSKASDFNNTPYLLSSNETNNQDAEKFWLAASGTWKRNDVFLLMTDALSQWFLQQQEQNINVVKLLIELVDQESFQDFIVRQRHHEDVSCRMKNDDVTLMKATMSASARKI
jgi:hypothetical protein